MKVYLSLNNHVHPVSLLALPNKGFAFLEDGALLQWPQ